MENAAGLRTGHRKPEGCLLAYTLYFTVLYRQQSFSLAELRQRQIRREAKDLQAFDSEWGIP